MKTRKQTKKAGTAEKCVVAPGRREDYRKEYLAENRPSSFNHYNTPGYLMAGLDTGVRGRALMSAKECIRGVEFDAIVVTGVSGMTFGAVLAHEMGKQLVVVRKPQEKCHSYNLVEGVSGVYRWLFVDDQIASGRTVDRVFEAMKRERPATLCVGIYLTHGRDNKRECAGVRILGSDAEFVPF